MGGKTILLYDRFFALRGSYDWPTCLTLYILFNSSRIYLSKFLFIF